MSLANKAARGALWTVVSSMGGRAIGVIGTLVMTRFLHPHQIGEVADATVLAMTASWISIWGFGQYAVVKGRGPDAQEVTFHAAVAYAVLGAISLGLVAFFGHEVMHLFHADNAAQYIPGMALALFIQRLGAIPERVLTRQMKFRASGMALAIGEASFTATSLTFAALGYGGMSLVIGKIVQACVAVAILIKAAGFASWATPTPLRWSRFRDMLRFGVPLAVQNIANQASRYWDKLAVSHFFGTGAVGTYNMAYNLADIPAIQVGEQIALVLMPSMASLPSERRPAALERSAALLSLIIFPLAIGLGLVAYPLISLLLPDNKWQEVAPLLTVLTCLSVFRPITWVLSAYLEAECKTNRLMFLELGKVVLLIAGIALLQPFGLRAAAAAVGIAFGMTAITGIAVVAREGVSPARMAKAFMQPLLACAVMATAVFLADMLLVAVGLDYAIVELVVFILVGAIAYIAAALMIARDTSVDLLRLLKKALNR